MHMFNDFKTSYVIASISKCAHKPVEVFCLAYILSHVANAAKPVLQQYIQLEDGKHALVDLYFPSMLSKSAKMRLEIQQSLLVLA